MGVKVVFLPVSFEISNMRNISACVMCVEERIFLYALFCSRLFQETTFLYKEECDRMLECHSYKHVAT
jgi:hypothetical protein